ncbi:DUF3788 domain-containing protein [Beduini massiliensis]|uniref:DUF3788 domain-containing protein n=1 Tax=Beduini massiliensis TaxID=1585974 RepID=UPI00059A8107|nr:DUF3788 domain-containing protein [Beduini massiliensis]
MLKREPTLNELNILLGDSLFAVWQEVCRKIEEKYEMDRLWNTGGKKWDYEYKYRRGGKTLCALYAKDHTIGFMIILGKSERERFEAEQENYSSAIIKMYDESVTYHDGKWMMFELTDLSLMEELMKLLYMKRRPNKR